MDLRMSALRHSQEIREFIMRSVLIDMMNLNLRVELLGAIDFD